MVKKYPLSLTFIKNQHPSTKAHTEKLKWTIITDFQFNNNNYYILAYDMNQPVPQQLIHVNFLSRRICHFSNGR
jgi:hypothetical protein